MWWVRQCTIITLQKMLMCHKVTHKNLIDNSPLFHLQNSIFDFLKFYCSTDCMIFHDNLSNSYLLFPSEAKNKLWLKCPLKFREQFCIIIIQRVAFMRNSGCKESYTLFLLLEGDVGVCQKINFRDLFSE